MRPIAASGAATSADWAGIAVTVVATLGAGIWALLKWSSERRREQAQERRHADALYLNPMLFAAEDLQSRLYNLLDKAGLVPLRKHEPKGRFAVETMHLFARYLAWEQLVLRFTYIATTPTVVRHIQTIRDILSSDTGGLDPWCLFRPTQTALGQAVLVWRQGETGFADTVPLQEFEEMMSDGLARALGLEDAVQSLRNATVITDLPPRTHNRLADCQSELVSLLNDIEDMLTTNPRSPFTLAAENSRRRSERRTKTGEA
jgi:hypothetical protein